MWRILFNLGCLQKFLTVLKQLHEGQKEQVKHKGYLSDTFSIDNSNSIKQGCVLAPTLFTIFSM